MYMRYSIFFFFSSRRRHTRCSRDWSSDVCSSDLDAYADTESGLRRGAERPGDCVDEGEIHRRNAELHAARQPDAEHLLPDGGAPAPRAPGETPKRSGPRRPGARPAPLEAEARQIGRRTPL